MRSTGLSFSQACPGKGVVRSTDRLNMTIAVDWEVKLLRAFGSPGTQQSVC